MQRSHIAACAGVAGLSAFLPALSVNAQVPAYREFELQARSNLSVNVNEGTYNLPPDTFFANATADINNNREVTFRLNIIEAGDEQGIFHASGGQGSIVYTSPAGAFLSDSTINNHGYIVFPRSFAAPNGVYFVDTLAQTSGLLTSGPLGNGTWGSPQVNDAGQVGYRGNFSGSGQFFYSYDPETNTGAYHTTESGVDPQNPYTFLFTPSFNNNRQIAGKGRLPGSGAPDEIRIFETDGSSTLIARTSALDPLSPYTGFDNSVSLNDQGQVAFTANLVGGGRGIFVSDGEETIEIATTAHPDINTIEFFAPALNNNGLVAFRARDGDNFYAIFVGDGSDLVRIVGQWDVVPTDNGPAWIAQHDSSVTFGGGVSINDHGDIVFNAALTPEGNNQIEWGSGIFIAYAEVDEPCAEADLNCDGSVGVPDLLLLLADWGPCIPKEGSCAADFDDDGGVGVPDLLYLLANWR